jgi:DNA-binding transcriptional LysR family regulator
VDTAQLTAFERIVRERSFSRAARALDIAQPTISERIKALERTLGGPLFARRGRTAELTDLGASFLPYARRALEVLESGVAVARESRAGERGRASVGVLESLSGALIGPVLSRFHAEHPNVEVLVRAGRQRQVMELLYDGVVGMAVVAWPCPESLNGELEPLLLMRERVVLVAAPNHQLARLAHVDMQVVAETAQPFLLLNWWLDLPREIAQLAEQAESTVDVPMDTGRFMVLHGSGAGYFPWLQVADLIATKQLREIAPRDQQQLIRDTALVRRVGAPPLSPAAEQLVEAVRTRAIQVGVAT